MLGVEPIRLALRARCWAFFLHYRYGETRERLLSEGGSAKTGYPLCFILLDVSVSDVWCWAFAVYPLSLH